MMMMLIFIFIIIIVVINKIHLCVCLSSPITSSVYLSSLHTDKTSNENSKQRKRANTRLDKQSNASTHISRKRIGS